MKMVTSTDMASSVLNEVIRNIDGYLGTDNDANATAIEVTKVIVNDASAYRDFMISQRTRAITALNELNITHDYSTSAPHIGA